MEVKVEVKMDNRYVYNIVAKCFVVFNSLFYSLFNYLFNFLSYSIPNY